MSRTIPPFLQHLRRDRRGLPVPYINRWGAEDIDRLTIGRDVNVKGPLAVFDLDVHETEPDFTAQNFQRQRECMIVGLCQICGRAVPSRRRFLAIADLSVERVRIGSVDCLVVTEPWLHEQCAGFAVEKCPALIRRERGENLEIIRVPPEDALITLSYGWIEGKFEERTRRDPVAMWAKVRIPSVFLPIDPGSAARAKTAAMERTDKAVVRR